MIQFGNKPLQSVIFGVLIDAINSLSNTLWQSAYRTFQNCNLASFITSHNTVSHILFTIIESTKNVLYKTYRWFDFLDIVSVFRKNGQMLAVFYWSKTQELTIYMQPRWILYYDTVCKIFVMLMLRLWPALPGRVYRCFVMKFVFFKFTGILWHFPEIIREDVNKIILNTPI